MSDDHAELRHLVATANNEVAAAGLVVHAFGNASQVDRDSGVFAIKPSGIPCESVTAEDIVVVALDDGEVIDLGGKRVRYLATPHVPHGWDAGLMFEEATGTLLCSDLLGQVGDGPALATGDIVGPALDAEKLWRSMSVTADTITAIERLAALDPKRLAIMHGASLEGGAAATLRAFARGLAGQLLPAAA